MRNRRRVREQVIHVALRKCAPDNYNTNNEMCVVHIRRIVNARYSNPHTVRRTGSGGEQRLHFGSVEFAAHCVACAFSKIGQQVSKQYHESPAAARVRHAEKIR